LRQWFAFGFVRFNSFVIFASLWSISL